MSFLSLHASFEFKQRINFFRQSLTMVRNCSRRRFRAFTISLGGTVWPARFGRHGSAKKTVTVKDTDLAHVREVITNRDFFADIRCKC